MKLELKHIAPYLPYGLKVTNGNEVVEIVVENLRMALLNSDEFKPILRPLRDLSKKDIDYMYFAIIGTDNDMYGSRIEFEDYFYETNIYHLPMCLYNYLIEWHFDVFGLIDKGLAVDINSLEK